MFLLIFWLICKTSLTLWSMLSGVSLCLGHVKLPFVHLWQVMVSGCLKAGSALCPPPETLCIRSWGWRKAAAMMTSKSPTGEPTRAPPTHLRT